MDNVAHALVGAAVGRAVGGERVPFAGALGAVAANASDWTEAFLGWPWPRAQYLALHRGITHSLAGAAVEIAGLTLVYALLLRGITRWRGVAVPDSGIVVALVAASVLSHPLMDWQGSYGLRPFLPWSGRWYYGDFVAIVDVWYWLLPLVALAWGAPRHWRPLIGYGIIWAGTTTLLFLSGRAAGWVRAGWILVSAAGMVGWLQHWFGPARRRLAAVTAIAVLLVYAGSQALVSIPVKVAVRHEAVRRFGANASWAALTVVGHPFVWESMLAGPDTIVGHGWAIPRYLTLPAARRAIAETEDGRAIAVFARFLAAAVDSGDRRAVRLFDVRYTPPDGNGWAAVSVPLP
jgi:inner membrane protein